MVGQVTSREMLGLYKMLKWNSPNILCIPMNTIQSLKCTEAHLSSAWVSETLDSNEKICLFQMCASFEICFKLVCLS